MLTKSNLLSSSLVYDSIIINDPLVVKKNITHKDLSEGLGLFSYFFELIRAGIIVLFPLFDLVQPNQDELPLFASDDAFRSSIPENIHDFIHENAIQKSVVPNDSGGMYVLSELASVKRRMALNVSFKDDYWRHGVSLYLFQTGVTEDVDGTTRLRTEWDPEGVLSEDKFNFWAYQTVNQAMRARLIGINTESQISQKLGHTYVTESKFEATLLNMSAGITANEGTEARSFFEANDSFLSIDCPETILKLRLKNPVLYHKFNRSLLDISGELQGYEGEQFNRKARLLFASEIEPQIKEVSACINSMKSGFIKGSLASLGGLSASVVTGSAVPFLTALGLSFANGLTESYSGVSQYQNLKKTPAFIWHRMNKT
ncbi:hypothetical protein [Vibrio aestuarianus]|uniref:Uncharacterized protein n=1 Tax=Vibrio aestuarianus TaxID=28171 RepID=A0ABN8TP19_9VIBR|nr:hypothetical protein [Vibrio aestuarianus]MDE1229372.1 hypothetical protein [Vibrio aestuarianus]MDE1259160.1 hypothetical protein [Vibrio aestuarianus]MDE1273296.1 hypothetical protein [Vibrio aestuarianus]MDH5893444.1 hypothetical protein [Vibrio aestuarianus]MDH5901674.1 hypothetical protein [Vibrio aestuarianus]